MAKIPYPRTLGRLLAMASRRSMDVAERRLSVHGLTLQQWVLMTALWRRDGLTIGEIATFYRATNATTSGIVTRMEAKSLVERRVDSEDGRIVRIYLTAFGQSKSHLVDSYKEFQAALTPDFTEDEIETLLGLLERVEKNAIQDLELPLPSAKS